MNILSYILAALLSVFPAQMTENAAESYQFSPYTYILLEDGSAQITNVTDLNAKPSIPGKSITPLTLEVPDTLDGHLVSALADGCFSGCKSLVSVSLPSSLTQMGTNPFAGCAYLKEISVRGAGVYAVENGVLWSKREDAAIAWPAGSEEETCVLPSEVKSISEKAFYHCENLRSVGFAGKVVSIGAWAFAGCDNLESVRLSEGLSAIGEKAFSGCIALSRIAFPDTLEEIGSEAFADCESLKAVSLPAGFKMMGTNPFAGCLSLQSFSLPASCTAFVSENGALIRRIDQTLVSFPAGREQETCTVPDSVRSIGEKAFQGCPINKVILPSSVQAIRAYAFENCAALREINLENVRFIGSYAFSFCESLRELSLGERLYAIGENAFAGCDMEEVVLPENLLSLGSLAFSECGNLQSVTLNRRLTWIGDNPFAFCAALREWNISPDHPFLLKQNGMLLDSARKKIICYPKTLKENTCVLPEDTKSIGAYAFASVYSLRSVELPEGLTSIGQYAFFYCAGLTEIDLPDTLQEMGPYAFSRCESLQSIALPGNLKEVPSYAFYGCIDLKQLSIARGVKTIGSYAFFDCENLTEIVFPPSVITLSNYAFAHCDRLRTVYLPDSLSSIGVRTFKLYKDSIYVYSRNLKLLIIAPENSYAWRWCNRYAWKVEGTPPVLFHYIKGR